MSRVWPGPEGDDPRGDGHPWAPPRPAPGADLAAAALVPAAAAVTVASGLLPWGARAALGAALLVLGWHGWTRGERLVRGAGAVALAFGLALLAAALAVAVDGGSLGYAPPQFPEEQSSAYAGVRSSTLTGLPAATFGVVLALAGAALVRRAVAVPVGVVALGAGGAALLHAIVGRGGVGVGIELGQVLLTLVAAVVAGLVVRVAAGAVGARSADAPSVGGSSADPLRGNDLGPWARAAGIGAGVLLALVLGEGTGLVDLVAGDRIGRWQLGYEGVVRGVVGVFATGAAGGLLAVAVRRRDPLLGLLPLGVLLGDGGVQGVPAAIGVLVLPVAALLLIGLAAAGRGPLAGRLVGAGLRLAAGAAVLVVLHALDGLVAPGAVLVSFSDDEVDTQLLAVAAASTAAVLAGVVLVLRAAREQDDHATAFAVVVLLGLYALHPVWSGVRAVVGPVGEGSTAQVLGLATELALAAVVVARRRRVPLIVGSGALILADVAGHALSVLRQQGFEARQQPTVDALIAIGPPALLLLLTAGIAALGPERLRRTAQAAAVGCGFATALSVGSGAFLLVIGPSNDDGEPIAAALAGGQVVVALVLALVVLAGGGLLAASATRRGAPQVVAVAAVLGLLGGILVAAVGAGVHLQGTADEFPDAPDAALGFGAVRSALDATGGGWPAGLAALAVLLAAAARWRARAAAGPAGD